MSRERFDLSLLLDAGFTTDELLAITEGLDFVVTMGEAGELGDMGDLGGGRVEWTPEKRAALDAYVLKVRAGRGGDANG